LIIRTTFRSDLGSRHSILLGYPFSEINQLAAFGAKGPIRIVLPVGFFAAGGTLHEIRELGQAS
jgi:hypothetical protein